jgi:hypothetical protein
VPIEGLDVRVLSGCSGLDVAGRDAAEAAAVAKGVRDEFGPVVAADQRGSLAAALDDPLKRLDRVIRAEAARCSGRERLSGVLSSNGQDLERPAVGCLVDKEGRAPTPRWGSQRSGGRASACLLGVVSAWAASAAPPPARAAAPACGYRRSPPGEGAPACAGSRSRGWRLASNRRRCRSRTSSAPSRRC